MRFAFETAPEAWLEISEAGTLVPGGGEHGEDVILSHAFLESLPVEVRALRGFIEITETEAPEGWIGWSIQGVDGAPTRVWEVPA